MNNKTSPPLPNARRRTMRGAGGRGWAPACVALGAALCLPVAPAQASEVVKLARLVITGKREPARPAPTPPERTEAAPSTPQRAPDGDLHVSAPRRPAEAAVTLSD